MLMNSSDNLTAFKESPAIIATNDDATLCKYSSVTRKYYEDRFIEAVIKASSLYETAQRQTRPPLANRGTFVRVKFIEILVQSFLDHYARRGAKSGDRVHVQIVSLGAGYDTLPFRLLDNERNCTFSYVELDFKSVSRTKVRLVNEIEEVRQLFQSIDVFDDGEALRAQSKTRACTYHVQASDLRDISAVSEALGKCNIDKRAPTIFIAECVLMYMEAFYSDALLRFVSTTFLSDKYFINFEPIKPFDKFGQFMMQNIGERGSMLLGILCYPD